MCHVLRRGVAVTLEVIAVGPKPGEPVVAAGFVANLHSKEAVPLRSFAGVVVDAKHRLVVTVVVWRNRKVVVRFAESPNVIFRTADIRQGDVARLHHELRRIVDLGRGKQAAVPRSAGVRENILDQVRIVAASRRRSAGRE